jgi:hypothetical protein
MQVLGACMAWWPDHVLGSYTQQSTETASVVRVALESGCGSHSMEAAAIRLVSDLLGQGGDMAAGGVARTLFVRRC